jgi:hypothetical protein
MLTVEEQIKLIADAAMNALDLHAAADRRATLVETVLDLPVADTSSSVQFTEEVVTMIDVKTTDPTESRQKRPMRVVVASVLAAAAAVVAIALVATRDADDVTPTDEPSTSVPPTPLSRALPKSPGELLEPGTYFVDEVDGTPTARISFTIGREWRGSPDHIWQIAIGYITFSRADRVFSDACHWNDGYYPGSVASLDDLVAALSEQGGWTDVTGPSDISIDGYAGKAFQRTAPAELSDCNTMPPNWSPHIRPPNWPTPLPVLRSWQNGGDVGGGGGDLYEPGEVETLWVFDIDGTIVVINTRLWPADTQEYQAMAGPGAAARDQFAAVLDTIHIDRG